MESAWIGLLGVIVGAGIGFGGNYLKLKHDDRIERRRLFLQKLEAIYRQVCIYHDLNVKFHLKINHQFYDANDWKRISDEKLDLTEASLLINLYAPDLKQAFGIYSDCVSNHILAAIQLHKTESEGTNSELVLVQQVEKAYESLSRSFCDLEENIVALSRKFTEVNE